MSPRALLALAGLRGGGASWESDGKSAFLGDPACWQPSGVPSVWSPFPFSGLDQQELGTQPELMRETCCSEGRVGLCWNGGFSFERCCTARGRESPGHRSQPSPLEGRCPPGYEVADGMPTGSACGTWSIVPNLCVVEAGVAFQVCDKYEACCGVSDTSNEVWRENHPGHLYLGTCPLHSHPGWKTCRKRSPHEPPASELVGQGVLENAGLCWTEAAVTAACCNLRITPLCGQGVADHQRFRLRCCTAGPGRPKAAAPLFPDGCRTHLRLDELAAEKHGKASPPPVLRPVDLGHFAEHFYRTGDALPSLTLIQHGIQRRAGGGDGLEMCPAAAVLAELLELERTLYEVPLQRTRARYRELRTFWGHLAHELWGVSDRTANATGGGSAALSEDQRTGAELLPLLGVGFERLRAQMGELEAVLRQRKQQRSGFHVHVVVPLCWPGEAGHLSALQQRFEPRPLHGVFTVFLYDICYGLFPPGSPAYDLRNELEVEIPLGSGAGRGPLPETPRPREPLPEVVSAFAGAFQRAVLVPFHEEVPVGEVAVFLRHMAVHYEDLPDALLFLHTDAGEHLQKDIWRAVVKSLALKQWPPSVPFLYLGHRHHGPVDASGRVASEPLSRCRARQAPPQRRGGAPSSRRRSVLRGDHELALAPNEWPEAICRWTEHAWEMLFGKPFRLPEDDFGGYDFGQFVAAREAVLRRPRAFWRRAWRAFASRSSYELLPGTRHVSTKVDFHPEYPAFHKGALVAMEHLWHVLFFPGAKSWLWPTRLRDPSLPLNFKEQPLYGWNPSLLRHYRWVPHDPL